MRRCLLLWFEGLDRTGFQTQQTERLAVATHTCMDDPAACGALVDGDCYCHEAQTDAPLDIEEPSVSGADDWYFPSRLVFDYRSLTEPSAYPRQTWTTGGGMAQVARKLQHILGCLRDGKR